MKIKYILCVLSIALSSITVAQRTELEITNAIQILSNFDDNVGATSPYVASHNIPLEVNIPSVSAVVNSGSWDVFSGETVRGAGALTKKDAFNATHLLMESSSAFIDANEDFSVSIWIHVASGVTEIGDIVELRNNLVTPIINNVTITGRNGLDGLTLTTSNATQNAFLADRLSINDQKWHQLIVSYKATSNEYFVYVDGVEIIHQTANSTSSAINRIEIFRTSKNADISIDQFVVYNIALEQEDIYNVNVVTSVPNEHVIASEGMGLYPNPSQDNFIRMKNVQEGTAISISTMTGELMSETYYDDNAIDMTSFEAGVYYLSILDENKQMVFTEKVIVL